jgi:hypothetical protein
MCCPIITTITPVHLSIPQGNILFVFFKSRYQILFNSMDENLMDIYDAKGAFNAFKFILSNDPTFKSRKRNNNSNLLTDAEKQQLTNIVQKYERNQNLLQLIIEFLRLFNIYLNFIGIVQGRFKVVSEHTFLDKTASERQALIVLNGNNTICGPLFVAFIKHIY